MAAKKSYIDGPLIFHAEDAMNRVQNNAISIYMHNIGYAGLGAENEFYADGGKRFFPMSKIHVRNHSNNLSTIAANANADIYLFQEMACKSAFSRNIDVIGEFQNRLHRYGVAWTPTIKLSILPYFASISVGNAIFSKAQPETIERISLPKDTSWAPIGGLFGLNYNFIITRYPIQDSQSYWTIINIHFSAFDKEGKLRKKQLEFLRDILIDEYNRGNYLVVGGDWNHRIHASSFPHTTEEEYLFWIHDLPSSFTPNGWLWAIDPSHPTVRTLERPYIRGENYTCIIDGFLVSPNVEIVTCETLDLDFQDSDHNPIRLIVRTRDP